MVKLIFKAYKKITKLRKEAQKRYRNLSEELKKKKKSVNA